MPDLQKSWDNNGIDKYSLSTYDVLGMDSFWCLKCVHKERDKDIYFWGAYFLEEKMDNRRKQNKLSKLVIIEMQKKRRPQKREDWESRVWGLQIAELRKWNLNKDLEEGRESGHLR